MTNMLIKLQALRHELNTILLERETAIEAALLALESMGDRRNVVEGRTGEYLPSIHHGARVADDAVRDSSRKTQDLDDLCIGDGHNESRRHQRDAEARDELDGCPQ